MQKSPFDFIRRSFRLKLLLSNLTVVILTVVFLFIFLMVNFKTLTDFSLQQNSAGMEQMVQDYMTKLAQEKATSTWLQMKAAQDDLVIMGKTAQRILDNYKELEENPDIFKLSLFNTNLTEQNGALAGDANSLVDTLIPPEIASNPRATQLLTVSGLLNLNINSVYEANENNAFLYFVGDPGSPVTRAYPNIRLVDVLGDGLNLLFWRDYFSQNVTGWTHWYTDTTLQTSIPSPVTVEAPYQDAAGQGMMVTMFYPLWNKETNQFAGAMGLDITLNNIIQNVLKTRVAKSGFAFMMNGKGEIIAIPETGYKLFDVNMTQTEQGGLIYYTGSLPASTNPAVQDLAASMLSQPSGVLKLTTSQQSGNQVIAYDSLPAFSDVNYAQDSWRIALVVPESEIFDILYKTDAAISEKSTSMNAISMLLAVAFILFAAILMNRFSNIVTQDLRKLAGAAAQVSAKNYNVSLKLQSKDELGQLGRTFETMNEQIRNYTTNLEKMVEDRTADLLQANDEISRLNDRLKDENLRLSAELGVARKLQMMVLPHDDEVQAITDLDIACYMHPANEVGGDYYDVLNLGDTTFLCIGDVTGHGLPSGVIMLMAETTMMTLSQSGETDMRHGLALLNRVLYRNIIRIKEDKNMTLAVVQYQNGEYNIVGQHESVIICRSGGSIEVIDTIDLGLPIGLEDEIDPYLAVKTVRLEPGDTMVLYTDGITEAENNLGQLFGMPQLIEAVQKYHDENATEIVNRIEADVFAYIGEMPVLDDISMVVIKQK